MVPRVDPSSVGLELTQGVSTTAEFQEQFVQWLTLAGDAPVTLSQCLNNLLIVRPG